MLSAAITNVVWIFYVVLVPIRKGVAVGEADSPDNHTRLFRALMADYEKDVPPLTNPPISVKLSPNLRHIVELIEKEEILVTYFWVWKAWYDERLVWNISEFGGIQQINLPAQKIWLPDIVLFNSADTHGTYMEQVGENAVVTSNGHVLLIPQVTFRTHCALDLRAFPYDTQRCSVNLGSWAYDDRALNLSNYMYMDSISEYKANTEWAILDTSFEVVTISYPCCKFPEFRISLTLGRKAGLLTYMFVTPAVVATLVIPALFLVPPSSGERTTLGALVILSLLALMQLLDSHLPPQLTGPPMIGVYYTTSMVFAGLAILLSALIMNVNNRGIRQNGVPVLLRKIFLGPLKRLVLLGGDSFRPYANVMSSGEMAKPDDPDSPRPLSEGKVPTAVERNLADLIKQLKHVNYIRDRQQIIENIVTDWKDLVQVCDRILFVLFVFISIVVTMSCLL